MVETGSYNLIYILTKMGNLTFKMKATIAIRKATSSRVVELMDSFVKNKLCEELILLLDDFGPENLKQIEMKPREERTEEE